MSDHFSPAPPEIRKLWKGDSAALAGHLLRLDAETRRRRFGAFMGDDAIRAYGAKAIGVDTLVFGAFQGDRLHAIGELHGLFRPWPHDTEIALSVEPPWQGHGIGSALFSRLVTAAQNRGVTSLHVVFFNDNKPMWNITDKRHPSYARQGSQIEASFAPPWATPASLMREIGEDTGTYLSQMLGR